MDGSIKNKYAQTITHEFSEVIKTLNRKPDLNETDDGKEYVNKISYDFVKQNNIKSYSRYTSRRAVFAERLNRTIRNFLKKPVFEKGKVHG